MASQDIRHHPADELLLSHVAGCLPIGLGLVVETHLELCPACRERVAMLSAVGGTLLDEQAPAEMHEDALARAFERIDEIDRQERAAAGNKTTDAPPKVPRKVPAPPPLPAGVAWPRALADCSATRWRWIAPGMRWSRVTVPGSPDANVFLLRIGPGKYLAQHTHTGTEMTQIIHGRFHDGRALFGPGDFDMADGDIHHQPVVQEGSECICVAAVDGRLKYDGVIARVFGSLVGI